MKSLITMVLLLLLPLSALALEIRVRGEVRLQVAANAAGTVAQISGVLTDELQRGLAHRDVEIRVEDEQGASMLSRSPSTDAQGHFAVQEELPPGNYRVFVRFGPSDHFDGIEFESDVELVAAPVDVRVFSPRLAVGRDLPVFVYGQASSAGVGFQGQALVYVNQKSAGTLHFDRSGRGSVDIAAALREGVNDIDLVVPGSSFREEATATIQMRFSERLIIEAALDERVERLTRGLSIHGVVHDATGPVAGIRVQGVFRARASEERGAGQESISVSTTTDDRGRYTTFVAWTRLGDGVWSGTARAIPNVGVASEIDVAPIDVDTTTSRAVLKVLGNLVLFLGLMVLLWSVARQGRLQLSRLREERARRRRSRDALETQETIVPIFLEDAMAVDSRNDAGGLVWDVWQSRPISRASIRLIGRGVEVEKYADAQGRFRFSSLPDDEYRLVVTCHGFVTGTMKLRVPHDGRFRSFRVGLVAVPLKIRRIYQSLLEEASGSDPWGHLSPSEIEDELWTLFHDPALKWKSDVTRRDFHARVVRSLAEQDGQDFDASSMLSAMTDIVEESYFSGREYDESVWMVARALALQLRAQAGLEELA